MGTPPNGWVTTGWPTFQVGSLALIQNPNSSIDSGTRVPHPTGGFKRSLRLCQFLPDYSVPGSSGGLTSAIAPVPSPTLA